MSAWVVSNKICHPSLESPPTPPHSWDLLVAFTEKLYEPLIETPHSFNLGFLLKISKEAALSVELQTNSLAPLLVLFECYLQLMCPTRVLKMYRDRTREVKTEPNFPVISWLGLPTGFHSHVGSLDNYRNHMNLFSSRQGRLDYSLQAPLIQGVARMWAEFSSVPPGDAC